MCVQYYPYKYIVEEDSLRRLSIGSVPNVEGERKEIDKYFQKLSLLGFHFMRI